MELQEFKQAVRKEMNKDFRAFRKNEIDEYFNIFDEEINI